MSIIETEVIDNAGVKQGDETCLCLLISDHIDWDDEYFHLLLLQEKINSYIGFIATKQYQSQYPDYEFQSFEIEIFFKEGFTDKCYKFLKAAEEKFKDMNIRFKPIHLP